MLKLKGIRQSKAEMNTSPILTVVADADIRSTNGRH